LKLSQELKLTNKFPCIVHVFKMASCKQKKYQNGAKMSVFELDDECKVIKNKTSLIMFLAATFL